MSSKTLFNPVHNNLATSCLFFAVYDIKLHCFIKGVLPRHQQIHEFVQTQQSEQVEHLLRTLKIIRKLSEKNDSIPSQIVQMYLLNEGEMGFMQPSEVTTSKANEIIWL